MTRILRGAAGGAGVDVRDYFDAFRKRWLIILTMTLLGGVVAAALSVTTAKSYVSNLEFFVSTTGAQGQDQLLQGSTFTQQQVKSYSQLVTTPRVLDPVIAKAGLEADASALASHVSASVPLNTVLIDVAVTENSPAKARKVADAIGQVFPSAVAELESVGSKSSPVKVTVVRSATLPTSAVAPRPVRNTLLGLIIGLIIGLLLALLRNRLDTTIKSEDDLEYVTDASVLGIVDDDHESQTKPLVVHVSHSSRRAEAFRTLRTNLQFIDAARHPRAILATSSLPGEGKSCTVANLALTLAATGSHVIAVEADLRRPRLLQYMGMENSIGLTDVLIGNAQLDRVIQEFAGTNMHVLGAGHLPPNPSELLGSDSMKALVSELLQRYEYVLLDAPPLLPVTDAAVLSTIVDGIVVMVQVNRVSREQLGRALDNLDTVGGRVLGLVLNRVPVSRRGRYTKYVYEYVQDRDVRGRRRRGKHPVRPMQSDWLPDDHLSDDARPETSDTRRRPSSRISVAKRSPRV